MSKLTSRILVSLSAAVLLAGCSQSVTGIEANGLAPTESTASAALTASGVTAEGDIAAVAPASADVERAQALFGPWTLARSGTPGCTVDLGSPNAVGEFTARTRRCTTVDLARIAIWTPVDQGLVLYDFERRPVVALAPAGLGLYEGQLWDGTRVTLFR